MMVRISLWRSMVPFSPCVFPELYFAGKGLTLQLSRRFVAANGIYRFPTVSRLNPCAKRATDLTP